MSADWGPGSAGGFLESVYREGLAIGLAEAEVAFEREAPLTVRFRGQPVGVFRPDFVVAGAVIVECKAVKALDGIHHAQLLDTSGRRRWRWACC